MISVNELQEGQSALLMQIDNETVATVLTEMGFLPNQIIILERIAPLGDPIIINNQHYSLSIRKSEAQYIKVKAI